MTKSRAAKQILSAVLFLAGAFLLANSKLSIIGAAVGAPEPTPFAASVFAIFLIIVSMLMYANAQSELETNLSSALRRNPQLSRLAEEAARNQVVQRELDHLTRELGRGNLEAGLGHPGHIEGTDIFYLRGRNGARLYYHRIGENKFEIVAKSAKGRNQDQVIGRIQDSYGKENDN